MNINTKEIKSAVTKLTKFVNVNAKTLTKVEVYTLVLRVLVATNKVAKGLAKEAEVFGPIAKTGNAVLVFEGISLTSSMILYFIDPSEEEAKKRAERKARKEEKKAAKKAEKEAKRKAEEEDDDTIDSEGFYSATEDEEMNGTQVTPEDLKKMVTPSSEVAESEFNEQVDKIVEEAIDATAKKAEDAKEELDKKLAEAKEKIAKRAANRKAEEKKASTPAKKKNNNNKKTTKKTPEVAPAT